MKVEKDVRSSGGVGVGPELRSLRLRPRTLRRRARRKSGLISAIKVCVVFVLGRDLQCVLYPNIVSFFAIGTIELG